MGRVYAIDYGRARIGLARSDIMKCIASPFDTVKAGKNPEESAKLIAPLLVDCEHVVVGLPLHLSGKESEMSQEVRVFTKTLESLLEAPISFFDERLSTAEVDRTMRESAISRKKRAKQIDTLSATLILQSFLDTF